MASIFANVRPFYRLWTLLLLITQGLAACPAQEEVRSAVGIPLRAVQWSSSSFWGLRLSESRSGLQKTMTPLMLGSDNSHFVKNFRIAAGMEEGKHRGPAWNDGDCYKWIEALAAHYSQTADPALLPLLNDVVSVIASAQRSDGYIHTPVIIAARNQQGDASPLGDPANFEMYNMGHLMTAATVHFEATGSRTLLEVAIKAADYLDREFSNPDISQARHAICPAHYIGALDLYRTTSDDRYLKLCQRWLNMRDIVEGGGDDNQDRIPFLKQREAVGHAVRANYLYAGAAALYLENKDERLLETLLACWESVHNRKIYVTGGCGALYDGASPDGSDKQSTITRIHQAYGRNFQLPNSTAHNETCAAIGNVMWNQRMWQITHQAKYIDALENSLYNAVLAGVSLDGERFFYTNTLRQLDEMPARLRWPRQRQEWISCYCCPPNVARTIAQVGRLAYSADDKAAIVLLYGSNNFDLVLSNNDRISLEQISDYPLSGQVRLQVKAAPDRAYSIGLRIPGWCDSAQLTVNGKPQSIDLKAGSLAYIERIWNSGDSIELNLEMPVQYLEAHPLVEECQGQIAVRRGPLIYCVESNDLPEDARTQQVWIAPGTEPDWSVSIGSHELAGVPQLQGPLLVGRSDEAEAVGTDSLYRRYRPISTKRVISKLTPYYAWGNRGNSEMSVWIPVQ